MSVFYAVVFSYLSLLPRALVTALIVKCNSDPMLLSTESKRCGSLRQRSGDGVTSLRRRIRVSYGTAASSSQEKKGRLSAERGLLIEEASLEDDGASGWDNEGLCQLP